MYLKKAYLCFFLLPWCHFFLLSLLLQLKVLYAWPVKRLENYTHLYAKQLTFLLSWQDELRRDVCSVQCGSLATCSSVRHMDLMCPANYGLYPYAGSIFGQCSKARDNFFLILDFCFFFVSDLSHIVPIKCLFNVFDAWSPHVSTRLLFEDNDSGLFSVTLFRKAIDDFRHQARENK